MKKIKIWQILFLLFLITATGYILTKGPSYQNKSGKIFGTYYNIIYQHAEELTPHIESVLQAVDNSLSPFNKQSIITAINENRDTPLDSMFLRVFTISQHISELTDGAFDITVAPLVNAWGFGYKNGIPTDSATIQKLLQYTGYNTIAYNNGKIVKQHPETQLDCSAVAKGYACDQVARMLERKGCNNFMVEIGGEVVTKGKNNKGNDWVIGINKPIEGGAAGELQERLHISGKSMATSGNYRNYRYENGKKVSHTTDPRTGYPVEHSLLSATVIANDCATADALATAFMVMGVEKAMEFCSNNSNIDALFIYSDSIGNFATIESKGLNNYRR